MPVGSTIELYTMLIAWFMYDSLWDLLAGTGVLMLPFIIVAVQLILDDNLKGYGVQSFVSAFENKMYLMVFMLFFTVAPYINVHSYNMSYTEAVCVPGGDNNASITKEDKQYFFENSGSSADRVSTKYMNTINNTVPKMPMWWFIWQRLSMAFTSALKAMLPCNPDFRSLATGLGSTVIKDDNLKHEVEQFYNDCWKSGVTRYWRDKRSGDFVMPAGLALNDQEAAQDISWIGSQILLKNANFYPALRANTPVKAFDYRLLVDGNKATEEAAGGHGFPYCDEWWMGIPNSINQPGLRSRLLSHITSQEDYSSIKGWWDYYWENSAELGDYAKDDFLIRQAFSNSKQLNLNLNRDTERNGLIDGIGDGVVNLVSNIGITVAGISNRAEANAYRAAAPIVQALLLMLFIMFLPLLSVASLYDVGKTLTLSVLMFTLIFWGYLFELAHYLDNFLLASLTEDIVAYSPTNPVNMLINNPGMPGLKMAQDDDLSLKIISWITRSAYVLLPAVFSWLLFVVGMKFGDFANSITSIGGGPAKSAAAVPDMAVSAAKTVVTKGTGKKK
jgi:hypothetical protein